MDPVSALSLVANIFAVVSFSKDVVNVACQIRDSGNSDQLSNLEAAAANLLSAIGRMNLNPDLSFSGQHPSQDDVVIFQIAQEITRTSQTITTFLGEVRRGKGQSRPSMLQTTLQTLRTIWNRKVTDELRKELSRAEQSLHLHAALSVKAKLEKNAVQLNDVLTALDSYTKDLLTSKSFLANFNQLNGRCEEIKENQVRGDQLAEDRHREIITSLDAVRAGLGSPTLTPKESGLEQKQATPVMDQILASVWFPQIRDREESVLDAYDETFEWVFQNPTKSGNPWHSFSDFLQDTSSGTYWISGKPGSGKSTLMKFISRHPTTKRLLQKWAGGSDVVMSSFFFHYLGSDIQKSEIGALCCLLYQILSQRRDLIQVAFPERFRALSLSTDRPVPFQPTVMELKRALNTVVRDAPSTPLFLLVDGLDEFNAESATMERFVTTLRSLTSSPNVKLLLSSRPWIIFERTLANCPSLKVHDLTRPDIARFVAERFRQYQQLWNLIPGQEGAMNHFMTEIVDASCGVFLWVRLAVDSVLEGLTNYDTIESLRDRFRELPTDLEDLYRHIWDRIPGQYRAQAARLLFLVERNMELEGRHMDLSLKSLAFAVMDDPEFAFSTAVKPLEETTVDSILETMKGRLISRCMGLLEVSKLIYPKKAQRHGRSRVLAVKSNGAAFSNFFDAPFHHLDKIDERHGYPSVSFIHRTVEEFLLSPSHRPAITIAAAGSEAAFYPQKGLLCAALMRLKTTDWGSESPSIVFPLDTSQFPCSLRIAVERCLFLANYFEKEARCPATRVLYELDRVMAHFQQTLLLPVPPLSQHWTTGLDNYPPELSSDAVGSRQTCDFLSICVYYNLTLFVKEAFATNPLGSTYTKQRASSLLGYALAGVYDRVRAPPACLDVMRVLFENGANPNEKHGCSTLWHAFMSASDGPVAWDTLTRLRVIKLLLLHGADPTIKLESGRQPLGTPVKFQKPGEQVAGWSDTDGNNSSQRSRSIREAVYGHRRYGMGRDMHDTKVSHEIPPLLGEISRVLDQLDIEGTTHNENSAGMLLPHKVKTVTGQGVDGTEGGSWAPEIALKEANGQSEGLKKPSEAILECREHDGERVERALESQRQKTSDKVETLQTKRMVERTGKAKRHSRSLRTLCCMV